MYQDLVIETKEGIIVNALNQCDLNKNILSSSEYNKFFKPNNISSIFHLVVLAKFFLISFIF